MTYEVFRYIFIGSLTMAILLLIVATILFFALRIPMVIGDLSGATAKKAIEEIRTQNESTGEKTYKSSKVNKERGRLTEKISDSGKIHKHPSGSLYGAMPTEKISTTKLVGTETTLLYETTLENQTTVLNAGNETTVLNAGNETTVLNAGNETTVLNSGNETTVLNSGNETVLLSPNMAENAFAEFSIEFDITYIHSDEVIV